MFSRNDPEEIFTGSLFTKILTFGSGKPIIIEPSFFRQRIQRDPSIVNNWWTYKFLYLVPPIFSNQVHEHPILYEIQLFVII